MAENILLTRHHVLSNCTKLMDESMYVKVGTSWISSKTYAHTVYSLFGVAVAAVRD